MDNGKREVHESYGMMSVSKTTCNKGKSLFGSSIKHRNTITLRIKTTTKIRGLNTNWYHSDNKPLIEIEMSPVQFAEAISTSINTEGMPVTLKYVNGKRMEECPEERAKEIFEEEFKQDIKDILGGTSRLLKNVQNKLTQKGALKVEDKKEIIEIVSKIHQDINANLPFVHNCFNEQLDKTVLEAKGEVEGFFINAIHNLGSKKLIEQLEENGYEVPKIKID